MALARLLAATQPDLVGADLQVVDQRPHRLGVALEAVGTGIDLRGENGHVRAKLPGPCGRCKPAVTAGGTSTASPCRAPRTASGWPRPWRTRRPSRRAP